MPDISALTILWAHDESAKPSNAKLVSGEWMLLRRRPGDSDRYVRPARATDAEYHESLNRAVEWLADLGFWCVPPMEPGEPWWVVSRTRELPAQDTHYEAVVAAVREVLDARSVL